MTSRMFMDKIITATKLPEK